MLGELIGEFKGTTTGTRILSEGKLESSGQGPGKILGIDASIAFTAVLSPLPNGILMNDGNSLITTIDGDTILANGKGVANITGKGDEATESGASFLMTQAQKFTSLNKVVGVYEFESDENGDWKLMIWEWK